MAALRKLNSPATCTACQRWLLSAFLPETAAHPTPRYRPQPTSSQRRAFRATIPLNSPEGPEESAGGGWLRGDDADSQTAPESTSESTSSTPEEYGSSSDNPWYLQVQEVQFDQSDSIAARQQLPALPDNPPLILKGLLSQLSIDIGLDYLSLVDLRTVDPPPALGGNLIMIFGTARSEKHLHVSADRFCRWLRTEHSLTPYADGLLGRNEFKLKMRRKLRRTKILSAAGARDLSDSDDGISTGWVCVNIGTVNAGEASDEELGDGAIGFGRKSDGTQIVVQMMTEDRRGELDLEGLWTGVLRGSLRRQNEIAETRPSQQLETPIRSSIQPQSDGSTARLLSQGPLSQQQQVRRLHIMRSCRTADSQSSMYLLEQEPDLRELEPHLVTGVREGLQDTLVAPETAHYDQAAGPGDRDHSSIDISSGISLRTHLNYLTTISDSAALEVLGEGEHDKSSTSFLQSFYSQLPAFLEMSHWEAVLGLHSHALHVGHTGYTQYGHVSLLRRMIASNISISSESFERAFETVLYSLHTAGAGGRRPFDKFDDTSGSSRVRRDPNYDPVQPQPFKQELHAFRSTLGLAFEVLDYMEAHGHDIYSESNLLSLHKAIGGSRFPSNEANLTGGQIERLQLGLRQALESVDPDPAFIPYALTTSMLWSYANENNWRAFWQTWGRMALSAVRRDENLYQILFDGVAASGNAQQARRVLHDQVEMMQRESPPVPVESNGELALALTRALQTAGFTPDAENGRWRSTWRKCHEGMDLLRRSIAKQTEDTQNT